MFVLQNGGDEYSLLVNLKRSYELQLLHKVPLEILYQDFVHILQSFRNLDDEVCMLKYFQSSVLVRLVEKCYL